MGLFDAFTGASVTKAAQGAQAADLSTGNFVDQAWLDALHGGQSELWGGKQQAQDALGTAHDESRNVINQFSDAARTDLGQNYGAAQGFLGGIQGLYQPYASNGTNASNMLANATGLNGAAGNTAATGAFQAGPGYQWQVDQATDAAARKAASLGIAGSGNTLTALSTLGSNLANTEYQQWLGNLSGQVGTGLQATAGQAAGLGAQGQLQAGFGNALAGVDTNQGQNIANLNSQWANGFGNAALGTASNLSNLYTNEANGVSNANVSLTRDANDAGLKADQAQMQGSSNLLGAITGIGKSVLGGLGGLGGGNLFGGIADWNGASGWT